jgi:hypothetical protein
MELREFMESLVGQRFNEQSLTKELRIHFHNEFDLVNITEQRIADDEDDDCSDWLFSFSVDDVDYDIYYLPMRKVGFDDAKFYITEVGFNENI